MKYPLSVILLCLILFSACSPLPAPIGGKRPPLTAHSTGKVTPTPTVLPFPSGNAPGWDKDQSILWCGYSSPKKGITGIRAQWIEPHVSGGPNSNVYIWIGVGGWGTTFDELIQIGTLAYTDEGGNTTHRVWYETVPQLSQLTSMYVAPGDTIAALMELEPGSHQQWKLSLHDLTQQTAFAIDITYPSSQMYADFIVEDPHLDSTEYAAPLYPFQRFSSIHFTNAHVRYADGWHAIGALRMMQISMIQKEGLIAYPSDITLPDAFSVIHAHP